MQYYSPRHRERVKAQKRATRTIVIEVTLILIGLFAILSLVRN